MAKKHFKRRPNNTGSVITLGGKRRKPHGARVTIGYDEETGAQVYKYLGFFENWNDANDCLTFYNAERKKTVSNEQIRTLAPNIHDELEKQRNKKILTFAEVFKILEETKYKKLKSLDSKKSWFKNLEKIHNRQIHTIEFQEIQNIFDDLKQKGRDSGTLSHMKPICKDIFEYSIINKFITKDEDFTKYLDVTTDIEKKQKYKMISIEDIHKIKKHNTAEAHIVMFYIMSGCRPNELQNLNVLQFHIDEEVIDPITKKTINVTYLITGSKTEAGKNRIIPIHDVVKPYIDILMECNKHKNNYSYRTRLFIPLMDELGMEYLPYDTRNTFASLCEIFDVDAVLVKRMMGHKFNDLTKDTYTHTVVSKLYKEIHKIKL